MSRSWFAILLVGPLSFSSPSSADSWSFPATIKTQPETHGDITIRRILDARKNQQYPHYSIEITRGDQLLARIPGVYFQQLFPAPDGSFFVGLSNEGLPGTAVIVFDREGRLKLEIKHGVAEFDYCEQSTTLVREWFDAEKPKVTFTKDPKWDFYTVTVRTCRGKDVDLMAVIRDAHHRSFQRNASGVR
jgi:hypothetical protein